MSSVSALTGSKVHEESDVEEAASTASKSTGTSATPTAKATSRAENQVARDERERALGNDENRGLFSGGEDVLREEARTLNDGGKLEQSFEAKFKDFAGKGTVSIERDGDEYVVKGTLSGGVYGDADRKNVSAEVAANVGASVLYRFKTPEGAADGAAALVQAGIAGQLAFPTLGASALLMDRDMIQRVVNSGKVSGFEVEVEGVVTADVKDKVAKAGLELAGTTRTKIDLHASTITFETEAKGKLDGALGRVGLELEGVFEVAAGEGIVSGEMQSAAVVRSTVPISPELKAQLLSGEISAAHAAYTAFGKAETQLIVTGATQSALAGNGVRFEVEKRILITGGDVDLSNALEKLDWKKDVEVRAFTLQASISKNVKASIAGFGAETKHAVANCVYKGDAAQLDEGIKAAANAILPQALASTMLAIYGR